VNYKNIVFVIAHNEYQQDEYTIPKKLLEEAGFQIITASNNLDFATAKDESTTKVDILIQDINLEDCGGIFLIGGPGALEHLDNPITYNILQKAHFMGKPLGAICISTRILVHAGILKDKQATGWNGDGQLGEIFKNNQVKYISQEVVVDGTIVTASGPHAANEFGEKIISVLQDQRSWG
jgi:protease I